MNEPRLVVNEPDFRIVELGEGAKLHYALEVEDGTDLLGNKRWREFRLDSRHLQRMFGYMIRMANKGAE